jgi:hypothetical protein
MDADLAPPPSDLEATDPKSSQGWAVELNMVMHQGEGVLVLEINTLWA